MTLQDKIRRDLVAGQSSSDALAERMSRTKAQCETVLRRMENEGIVFSFTIPCGITVWRLHPHHYPPKAEETLE